MTLEEFLKIFGRKEDEIVEYTGADALKAVEDCGVALRYVDKKVFLPPAVIQRQLQWRQILFQGEQ